MRASRVIALLVTCALVAAPSLAEATGKKAPRRVVQDFTATAYPGLLACSMESGVYVTATHRSFTAPANGHLDVLLDQFGGADGTGDWDLYLRDSAGNILTDDFTIAPTAEVVYRVKKGQTYDIMMCNFDEIGTTAHGKTTFVYG
ncbi:MAG: hypothetical protein M3O32_18530 [Actinomycetota bacterium]|nr:hypothetical protein [Actinomycetota bacterium]